MTALFLWMAPTGDHHSLTFLVELAQHFGLGRCLATASPFPANPGSIPPLGTIFLGPAPIGWAPLYLLYRPIRKASARTFVIEDA